MLPPLLPLHRHRGHPLGCLDLTMPPTNQRRWIPKKMIPTTARNHLLVILRRGHLRGCLDPLTPRKNPTLLQVIVTQLLNL